MPKKKTSKIEIKVRFTPDQVEKIHERMKEAHTDNREGYIRKMALDGYILEVDAAPFKEMCRLLRRVSNNFNQVARRANSSGHVYETDLLDMAKKMNQIRDAQNQIIMRLGFLK